MAVRKIPYETQLVDLGLPEETPMDKLNKLIGTVGGVMQGVEAVRERKDTSLLSMLSVIAPQITTAESPEQLANLQKFYNSYSDDLSYSRSPKVEALEYMIDTAFETKDTKMTNFNTSAGGIAKNMMTTNNILGGMATTPEELVQLWKSESEKEGGIRAETGWIPRMIEERRQLALYIDSLTSTFGGKDMFGEDKSPNYKIDYIDDDGNTKQISIRELNRKVAAYDEQMQTLVQKALDDDILSIPEATTILTLTGEPEADIQSFVARKDKMITAGDAMRTGAESFQTSVLNKILQLAGEDENSYENLRTDDSPEVKALKMKLANLNSISGKVNKEEKTFDDYNPYAITDNPEENLNSFIQNYLAGNVDRASFMSIMSKVSGLNESSRLMGENLLDAWGGTYKYEFIKSDLEEDTIIKDMDFGDDIPLIKGQFTDENINTIASIMQKDKDVPDSLKDVRGMLVDDAKGDVTEFVKNYIGIDDANDPQVQSRVKEIQDSLGVVTEPPPPVDYGTIDDVSEEVLTYNTNIDSLKDSTSHVSLENNNLINSEDWAEVISDSSGVDPDSVNILNDLAASQKQYDNVDANRGKEEDWEWGLWDEAAIGTGWALSKKPVRDFLSRQMKNVQTNIKYMHQTFGFKAADITWFYENKQIQTQMSMLNDADDAISKINKALDKAMKSDPKGKEAVRLNKEWRKLTAAKDKVWTKIKNIVKNSAKSGSMRNMTEAQWTKLMHEKTHWNYFKWKSNVLVKFPNGIKNVMDKSGRFINKFAGYGIAMNAASFLPETFTDTVPKQIVTTAATYRLGKSMYGKLKTVLKSPAAKKKLVSFLAKIGAKNAAKSAATGAAVGMVGSPIGSATLSILMTIASLGYTGYEAWNFIDELLLDDAYYEPIRPALKKTLEGEHPIQKPIFHERIYKE